MIIYRGINVFISSPEDVSDYRQACINAIEKLNEKQDDYGICFIPRYYEQLAPEVIADRDIQNYIDRQIPMEEVDIAIFVFGNRFGTPTHDYSSGTEAEFEKALKVFEETEYRNPKMLLFHCTIPVITNTTEEDLKQMLGVKEFFDKCKEKKLTLARKISSIDELVGEITKYLENIRKDHAIRRFQYSGDSDNIWANFFQKIYLKEERIRLKENILFESNFQGIEVTRVRSQRTDDKRDLMTNVKQIDVLAHAGYSYLVETAGRMYKDVFSCLENGGKVRFILTNPFSHSGLLISLSDEAEETAAAELRKRIEATESFNIISFIEKSEWYCDKLKPALKGFKKLHYMFGDKIELRILGFDMYATTLFTEKGAFYEPYLLAKKEEHDMTSFEVMTPSTTYLYNNIRENFELLWELSEPYSDYINNIDGYKKRLIDDSVFI